MGRLTAMDLFCGAGGLSEGFRQADFDVILGIDFENSAIDTFKKNFGEERAILADIREVTANEILERAKKLGHKKIDVVIGGPPCQGFSTLGDKISSDPRNTLFSSYARLVNELNPKCVLIENVKAFTTMYGGQFTDLLVRTFNDMGYTMRKKILNAADYGVPQIRERVFFFGTRLKHPFSFPTPSHGGKGLMPYETVGKWIMDLAQKDETVPNHWPLDHSKTVIKRYKLVPEGGKLPPADRLPKEIRRKNFGNTYKRLHRKRPSLTLVPGNNAFPIHPTLNRSLTPREAARLQTFPDTFVFEGNRRDQCVQIGDAVPPLLAKKIAQSAMLHMKGKIEAANASTSVAPSADSEISPSAVKEKIIPVCKLSKLSARQGFIDVFSGAGGFVIGMSRAGWRPLLVADNDPSVIKTHEYNFPSIPIIKDDISLESTRNAIIEKFRGVEVGIVVGGPPCQGFSMFGKRRFVHTRGYDPHADPRNKLVYSYMEVVKEIFPRWFVMENVPGLKSLDDGLFLEDILKRFRRTGYRNAEARILNSADYGVPQMRRRLIIIGNRTGHIIPWPKKKFFNNPKSWQKPYRTAGEVITDIASESSYSSYTCHVPMNHKPLLAERYKLIPEGGKLETKKLPLHLKSGYRTTKVKNYSHIYKRLHRDEPSITIVPGHNALPLHPWLNRSLTVREAARIQTFPDELTFLGTRQNQCIQVGNAFPPLLAELIGNTIRKAEVNGWFPRKVPSSAYYSLVEKSKPKQLSLLNVRNNALSNES